jgi:hypothetical protein
MLRFAIRAFAMTVYVNESMFELPQWSVTERVIVNVPGTLVGMGWELVDGLLARPLTKSVATTRIEAGSFSAYVVLP